jgi:hypothetical protein
VFESSQRNFLWKLLHVIPPDAGIHTSGTGTLSMGSRGAAEAAEGTTGYAAIAVSLFLLKS